MSRWGGVTLEGINRVLTGGPLKASAGFGIGRIAVADAAYTALTIDSLIVYTSLSAARTVTLPAANTYNPGQILMIVDGSGSSSQTNAISIAPNGSDTIAGSNTTQVGINIKRGRCWLVSNGSNGWDVLVWSVIYTAALSGDVALNNTGNYFTGPSVAQGTVGTWEAMGTITVVDSGGAVTFQAKLWDGTSVIASTTVTNGGANESAALALSGLIAAPVGDVKISARDVNATTGAIKFNASGSSLDSTLTLRRVA